MQVGPRIPVEIQRQKRLKLAQLLGRHGVLPTWMAMVSGTPSALEALKWNHPRKTEPSSTHSGSAASLSWMSDGSLARTTSMLPLSNAEPIVTIGATTQRLMVQLKVSQQQGTCMKSTALHAGGNFQE
jgi:hypothetical protein